MAAFFDVVMQQFTDMESIALFRLERMYDKEPALTVEAFQHRNKILDLASSESAAETGPNHSQHNGMEIDFFDCLQQTILKNTELDEHIESIPGHDFLIKKVNQDKQISFFIVYQFAGKTNIELHNKSASNSPRDNCAATIQLIRYLSDIYSNHQLLISLNDKDSLTGLYNRKFFDRKMNQLSQVSGHQLRRQAENNNCDYLAILDIDHFKKINDTYGHLSGDEVLLHFAQQMQKVFREDDWLFRYGGEEFVVILKCIDCSLVESILHRFRAHIESYHFPKVEQVTVSIGVTRLEGGKMQSDIVERADHALYYIKEHGRNNVAYYEELVRSGLL